MFKPNKGLPFSLTVYSPVNASQEKYFHLWYHHHYHHFFFQAGNLKAGVKQNVGPGQDSGTKVGAYFLMGN